MERLETVKNNGVDSDLYRDCINEADNYLGMPILVITQQDNTFVEDKHYYSSIGIYWWPDPNNPGGKYIRKDGVRNPESNKYGHSILYSLGYRLTTLSVAFFLTNDSKYREGYFEQLRAFSLNTDTYMYPNFEYAQIVPGYFNNHGRGAGIIEAEIFTDILDSYRLVDMIEKVDEQTDRGIKKWFSDFLTWMLTSELGKSERAANGNIPLFYDVLALDIAVFVKNKALMREFTRGFRKKRLDVQIMSDGSQPVELARTRGFFYSIFNLKHIVDFCIIQESLGNHYYKKNRDIIDRAFLFLIPYIGNQEAFKYQQITSWDECEDQLKRQILRLERMRPNRNITYDFSSYRSNLHYNKISQILD